MKTTLERLEAGTPATVAEVGGAHAFRRRLLELGLLPGTPVSLVRVAPLGDPIEIALRGGRLSLRKREAAAIVVET